MPGDFEVGIPKYGPCFHPDCPRKELYKRLSENPNIEGMMNPFSPCEADYCPLRKRVPERKPGVKI